ncbi:CYFA0S20e01750g1_1 [Cyberlindnera fabianii]|uniref:CYFA0S20e01750g1_1 n=1 Tax=Cyberlindnera fabianii TaxID=36022 RepID=A0A061B960_CYBFA|nr:CYFA0S20e01750g1_1 [Cyberlindnera fabianii]
MGQQKAYSARSRRGCVTCKRRRVKCDEQRPICLRCDKLGIKCEFQGINLTWEDEAHQRGITFGRSLKARTARAKNSSSEITLFEHYKNNVKRRDQYIYVNFTSDELGQLHNGLQLNTIPERNFNSSLFTDIFEMALIPTLKSNNTVSNAFDFIGSDSVPLLSFDDLFVDSFAEFPIAQVLNVTEPTLDQCSFNLTDIEERLMHYFIDSIAPRCVCVELKAGNTNALNSYIAPELNPYLHLIVPLSFNSKLLMKTLIATSASQLALLGETEYVALAKDYLKEVVTEISKLIESKTDHDGWDDVFAIIIMLCFVEISVSCNNSWLSLLNYAKSVLKGSTGVREKILSPMGKFFVRYFISHEVMGETAWVQDGVERYVKKLTIEDDPFIEELKKDYDTKIDLVFGCSPYLISLIHRISVIGQGLEDIELELPGENKILYTREILKHAEETEQMLNNLNQRLPTNSEIYFDSEERTHISTISEIKRLAALLYLHAAVYTSTPPETTTLDPQRCTAQIMRLCNTLPDCYMSLIWPLFVVGLVSAVNDEQVRWFVLEKLRLMERKRRLRTVQAAREIVVNVWKETDMGDKPYVHWRDIIKGKTTTISLA